MKRLKNKNGISLIVLVITIIVMIILATAIILSLRSSGIIDRANEAKTASDVANAKNVVSLAYAEWELDQENLKEKGYESLKKYAEAKLQEAGIDFVSVSNEGAVNIIYTDKNGKKAIIPDGFVVSEATGEDLVEYGLVIYEGDERVTDDNVAVAKETRNQFVWVPVPDFTKFERTTTYDGTTITDPGTDYSEPYSTLSFSNDSTGEWAEWTAMRASVEEYGGFYIGRYEAGTTEARTETSSVTDVLVQKNKSVYNYVPWGTSMTEVGTIGAVYLSRSLYNTSAVKSTLCYGVQWDAALNFIATSGITDTDYATDSTGKGNGTWQILVTGYSNDYALNNIYDMAGNVSEWTMEAFPSEDRVHRGASSYDLSFYASQRFTSAESLGTRSADLWGFRITLYIK